LARSSILPAIALAALIACAGARAQDAGAALAAIEMLDIGQLLDEHPKELGCLAAGYLALVLERTRRPRRPPQPAPRQAPHAGR